jgi:IS5 family transposase
MERNLYTFGDLAIQKKLKKVRKANVLAKIHKLINWNKIQEIVSIADSRSKSVYGRDCYDPLTMFKVLFLQAVYNFSDRDIEEHLNFNTLYLWFCGFSIESELPDHSTIARWRERFIECEVFDNAFYEINNQLDAKGLDIKNAMIVDASLVTAKSRPRKTTIITVEPTGDEISEDDGVNTDAVENQSPVQIHIEESKDGDARWLKKGKRSYYGYKKHISTNKEGFINGVITTPANFSDTSQLPDLIDLVNPAQNTDVSCDKGYCSKKNRDILHEKSLNDRIMRKKKKNQDRDNIDTQFNKAISKVRYVVERAFGCLKQNLGCARSWYIGRVKTHNFIILRAMAHNLIRAVNHSQVVVQ